MKLGYARISTADQNAAMQVEALVSAGVAEDKIFVDEMSGAKSARERPQMVKLLDYARDGDEIFCWRIDRLGRSLVDVINTVNEITSRGIRLHSIMDGVDPSTAHGRLQLALFASLAEYERELINERVRAGVMAAKARGVQFGKPAPKAETVETKVRLCRQMMAEGMSSVEAAEAVNWSKATMYRYLKQFGEEGPVSGPVRARRGASKYTGHRHEPAPRT
jgi:DNA invertase Pin-like site-specific DNA recombinase